MKNINFEAKIGEKMVRLSLAKTTGSAGESKRRFSSSNINKYSDDTDERLIRYAGSVRRQLPFGFVHDDDHKYLKELSRHYTFEPFEYQYENVSTMLNRFGGLGVHGDQAGLGKTVEALMCAHVMFECGAIKNALIVVPEKTKEGWKSEIREKFPGVFSVRTDEDFDTALRSIARDGSGSHGDSGYPIYIITSDAVERNAKKANGLKFDLDVVDSFCPDESVTGNGGLTEKENKFFDNELRGALKLGALRSSSFERNGLKTVLTDKYGYGLSLAEYIEKKNEGQALPLYALTKKKSERLIDILRELRRGLAERGVVIADKSKRINECNEYIGELITRSDNVCGLAEQTRGKRDLYLGSQLVDLLIVDEIHNFYTDEKGSEEATERHSQAIKFLSETVNKKYCILVSATPVRTRLEDVLDLIRLADGRRLGDTPEEISSVFYNVICGINKSEPYKLITIIENEEKRRKLFGLISNFFTRRRLSYVRKDMSRAHTDSSVISELNTFIEENKGLKEQIINKRTDMYLRGSIKNLEIAKSYAKDGVEKYLTGNIHSLTSNNIAHIRSSINYVLTKESNRLLKGLLDENDTANKEKLLEKIKACHSHIGWARPAKRSLLLDLNAGDQEVTAQKNDEAKRNSIVQVLNNIDKAFHGIISGDEIYGDVLTGKIGKELILPPDVEELCNERRLEAHEYVRPFIDYFQKDFTLVHISLDRLGGEKGKLRYWVKNAYEKKNDNRRVMVNPTFADIAALDDRWEIHEDPPARPVVIIDEKWQAGVNLQKFGLIVFTSMDDKNGHVLDPVDIEQWIARVHRTGQVRTCRVITVLDSYVAGNTGETEGKKNYKEFLKWYWETLADPKGFALYGTYDTETAPPDIAFLQPVVADWMRRRLGLGEAADKSFSKLAELCYDKEDVRNELREAIQNIKSTISELA